MLKLTIEGYKSIGRPRTITLPGLTVLSGTNSSGKSSFMQPLLLLKQTLENEYDSGTILLDGPNVKITDITQMKSRVDGIQNKNLKITLETNKEKTIVEYAYRKRIGLAVESVTGRSGNSQEVKLTTKLKSKEVENIFLNVEKHQKFMEVFDKFDMNYKVARKKCFLFITAIIKDNKFPLSAGIDYTEKLSLLAQRTIHVPGLRGNPERSYKTAASQSKFPGSFEKYVASIVHEWRTRPAAKDKFIELVKQLNHLGLASSVGTGFINDTRLEVRISRFRGQDKIRRTNKNDAVNIADVGFGVSQTLPVLVALITASKDQLVYIEQPELHLHPKAQFNLANSIAEAVNRGVVVVIETHSSILLRGIQILVAEKKMLPEKISLNWFTQNRRTGQSEVKQATLDAYGAFGDWPEDFDETSIGADQQYLDAVEKAIHEE